jgi:hypothetical protein
VSNLEYLETRLADLSVSLASALRAAAALEQAGPDDCPLTVRQSAALLLRADKLVSNFENLADELATLASELPAPSHTA